MLTIKQERENNMYLNKREAEIIGTFMDVEDDFEGKKLILKWNNGSQVTAVYDTYIEDEADCEIEDGNYEEFWSFVFKAIDLIGEPPVYITEDEYFCVNYHNFPDEIIADSKKIN